MDLLVPSTGLLFWMTIIFLIVLFLLWKFGFPAIVNMVNARKAFIDDSLRKAHEANEKLANIQQMSETLLQEARQKQSQILKEAAQTRDNIIGQAQEKARGESVRIISEAKAEIENEKQNAIRDIRNEVAVLSVQIAEKILREKLGDDKKQMEMIDRMLDEVAAKN